MFLVASGFILDKEQYKLYKDLQKQFSKVPYAHPRSPIIGNKLLPVSISCPKCNRANFGKGHINIRTGICDNPECRFNIEALTNEEYDIFIDNQYGGGEGE